MNMLASNIGLCLSEDPPPREKKDSNLMNEEVKNNECFISTSKASIDKCLSFVLRVQLDQIFGLIIDRS